VQQAIPLEYLYLLMDWLCHCRTLLSAILREQILQQWAVMPVLDLEKLLA
jgi:hypothetical protein